MALFVIAATPSLALAATPSDQQATQPQVTMEEMLRQDQGAADQGASTEDDAVEADDYGADTDRGADRPSPQSDPNWAAIIGQNALWGGITGGLIGLGAWLVTGRDFSPWVIAQFFGGGLLVGAAIGVISLSVHTDRYAHEIPGVHGEHQGAIPLSIHGATLEINGRF